MDNQHRQIKGYRELTQYEIDVMNAVKQLGVAMQEQLTNVSVGITAQRNYVKRKQEEAEGASTVDVAATLMGEAAQETRRLDEAQPERWAAIARTHFQEGLMALTRAVAQPGFF